MHIAEVCLEIFEVIILGHSFYLKYVVLKLWRSSLLGNPALELTKKWVVGWWREEETAQKGDFTDCGISEVIMTYDSDILYMILIDIMQQLYDSIVIEN